MKKITKNTTLEEAIRYYEAEQKEAIKKKEKAMQKLKRFPINLAVKEKKLARHKKVLEWLKELKNYRDAINYEMTM